MPVSARRTTRWRFGPSKTNLECYVTAEAFKKIGSTLSPLEKARVTVCELWKTDFAAARKTILVVPITITGLLIKAARTGGVIVSYHRITGDKTKSSATATNKILYITPWIAFQFFSRMVLLYRITVSVIRDGVTISLRKLQYRGNCSKN